ncbi:MAG: isochorismate synthase [Chromatiales bacterium]|nr:isochorismate synthase [Chromatiales bacterium]
MSEIDHLIDQIQHLLDQTANNPRQQVCVSLPLSGPCTGLAAHSLPNVPDERYFWARPDSGEYWLGLGSAWRYRAHGGEHLLDLASAATTFSRSLHHIDPTGNSPAPRISLASEHQHGRLSLPEVQIYQIPGSSVITVAPNPTSPNQWRKLLARGIEALNTPTEPLPGPAHLSPVEQRPDASVWLTLSEQAVNQLGTDTELKKLVLSRQVRLQGQRTLSPSHLLQVLLCQQAHCTVFVLDNEDEGCWIGASPEILLTQQDQQIFTEAVAGTIRRDNCKTVDDKLGEWLLRDSKNRHEHELVVNSLRGALAPLCGKLDTAEAPRLLKLRGLQHLHTPISGTLNDTQHPLRIAHKLHPSPAICGYPRATAQHWLQQHEPLDRGLFTGLTGWIDIEQNATLNVVLRCARIEDDMVDLYAGAGLVADSNALAEWEETELKLNNMIEALQEA